MAKITDAKPVAWIVQAIPVICSDGHTRSMLPEIGRVPDLDQPRLIMLRGTVDFDDQMVTGVAWHKEGLYYFTPDERS